MLSLLHIEPSGVPIYVQLRDQVLRAIGAGLIKPGERLPTMRQVAVALRIDLNTVKHAYDALARTGAIDVLPARGSFVAQRASPTDRARQDADIDDLAHRTIAASRGLGVDPTDVAQRILTILRNEETHP